MKVTTLILAVTILLPTVVQAQSSYERPYRTVPVSPGYYYYQMKDGTTYPGYYNYYNKNHKSNKEHGNNRYHNSTKRSHR